PNEHQGAELANQAGGFCWTELTTRDIDAAKAFYPRVFGWGVKDHPGYTEWTIDDRSIAGAMTMGDNFPPEVPPHWVVYFAVEDADATAAKAQELGGRASPIMDSPAGRFAILNDPHGAVFAVIKLS
ncbi:MAG TPA: VOC family protein, partial [Reyranella sp.]|nr:VOC family protein [Reyranella sp.]